MSAFIVHVIDDNYEPVQDIPVTLEALDMTQSASVKKVTDALGYATFDEPTVGVVRIFIHGNSYGKYHCIHGRRILVTL